MQYCTGDMLKTVAILNLATNLQMLIKYVFPRKCGNAFTYYTPLTCHFVPIESDLL